MVEQLDPSIKHRLISVADVIPNKDLSSSNRNPKRQWCEGGAPLICIQSRYQLEGRLPTGIMLVNQIRENQKNIADFMEFQSELRLVPEAEIDQAALAKATGIDAPVAGVVEQNIFYVNQIMQFGKFLAVLQPDPADARKSVATAFVALAVDSELFEKKKELESVPILRNLVPAQVLAGNSSFNTGNSISLAPGCRNIPAIASRPSRHCWRSRARSPDEATGFGRAIRGWRCGSGISLS